MNNDVCTSIAIINCLFLPTFKYPQRFSVWRVLKETDANPRNVTTLSQNLRESFSILSLSKLVKRYQFLLGLINFSKIRY